MHEDFVVETLVRLETKVDSIDKNTMVLDSKIDANNATLQSMNCKIEALDKTINGDSDSPGLKGRVIELETTAEIHDRRWRGMAVGICIAIVTGGVTAFFEWVIK